MPPELSKDRQKRYTATQAQNLLKEFGDLLAQVAQETKDEYSQPINATTVDEIAIVFSRHQGAKQAVDLFMKKLNSKANG